MDEQADDPGGRAWVLADSLALSGAGTLATPRSQLINH
jgi:hypothetical protein